MDALTYVKESLWKEYTKTRWQQQRFRLYGGKKRVFAKFLNRLGSPKDTVLAFGNAKFEPGGKGELSIPTSRAYKECSYRFKTLPIDEFRTSKVNWKTLDVLDTVAKRKNDKLVEVRGLLWCRSTNQSEGKFVDRDVNAAINIQRCAILPTRPLILQRAKAAGKLEQRVGKIIRC
jgi:transposase